MNEADSFYIILLMVFCFFSGLVIGGGVVKIISMIA